MVGKREEGIKSEVETVTFRVDLPGRLMLDMSMWFKAMAQVQVNCFVLKHVFSK